MTFPFSILYREFEEILSSSCESIFVLLQDRAHKCAIESSKCPSGPWIKDSGLHTKLSSLKGWAEVVSKSCTKLTVIVTKVPTADHVKSILQEMCGQVSAFVGSYMSLTECSLGNPFFVLISTKVRAELLQVKDLVSILKKGAMQNANTATGMVWKTCEDIQTLPLSNKAAYRRALMEKISVVKDTIREFDGYVCQAKAKVDTMMDALNLDSVEMSMNNDEGEKEAAEEEDGEDDNEMEDMDEDECYDINEIQTAEESISTMRVAMEVLKCSLTILTTVADQNSRTPSAVAISSRTSAAIDSDNQSDLKDENNEKIDHDSTVQNAEVEGNGDVINSKQSIDSEGLNDADDNYSCDQWVADVSQYAAIIENAVTDFGAELYPPLNATALENLGIQGGKLKNNLHFYILLLQKKSLHIEESHHEESPSITSIALENFLQLVTVSK